MEGFLQDSAQLAIRECVKSKEMKFHFTENPPQCNLLRMLAFSQNRLSLGFDVRLRLKNYWFIAQSELRAERVEKDKAGSGRTTSVILVTVGPKHFSLFCVLFVIEIHPFSCHHDLNQFCVGDLHNLIPCENIKITVRTSNTWYIPGIFLE